MTQAFDLLGDPIPEGWGRRGRPAHVPTQENRRLVIALLAFKKEDDGIAAALGITRPTLRKHYFRELRAKADARARLDAKLLASTLAQVEEGNVAAMTLLFKRVDKLDMENGGLPVPKPAKLGKKEQAKISARQPPKAWGELVN